MKRSKISGMTIEEYRSWMKQRMDDIYLKNESDSVDDIVENMADTKLYVSSVDKSDFSGIAI
ncbi:MAG: hypothetical protein IJ682_04425 [Lachnospiraceae bacterium]|nr:hypothetical protein [Lachnospiraceae bacterium]